VGKTRLPSGFASTRCGKAAPRQKCYNKRFPATSVKKNSATFIAHLQAGATKQYKALDVQNNSSISTERILTHKCSDIFWMTRQIGLVMTVSK
jgi:hypothetical protein